MHRQRAFEGAAAEVAGFLSVASKGAALALLARLAFGLGGLTGGHTDIFRSWHAAAPYLVPTLAVFAVVTMTFGNLAAYAQTNLKRLLAYSTIAHAGYMLMAVAAMMVVLNAPGRESVTPGAVGHWENGIASPRPVTQLAIAQHVPVQIRIAEIAAQIDAAELLARRALAIARKDYTGMSLETRTLLRRDFTYAMHSLRAAMDALVKISGSSGLMDGNSVQRCWRDVHAISSHVVMNWDVPAENFGRTEFGLGLNPAYPMF